MSEHPNEGIEVGSEALFAVLRLEDISGNHHDLHNPTLRLFNGYKRAIYYGGAVDLEAHHDLERILCTRSSRKISSHGIVSYENRYFAIDLAQFRRLSSRIVNVRATSGGRIIIEQGEYALRYAEIENPSPTRRAQVTDRADLPQPNKAHIPSSTHPWRTYSSPRPHPRGHL